MFYVFIVLTVVAALVAIGGLLSSKPGAVAGAVALFLLGLVASSVGTVPTKNVGVVTSFNKPTGETYSAGAYWKAPWKSVTDMSLAWQTDTYQFGNVQAAGGTTVGLDIRPRWRMTQAAAPDLFQNHKDFQSVKDNLFKNELEDAANKLFASYNPLTNLNTETGQPIKSKEQWATELQAELTKRFAGKAEIDGKEQVIQKIEIDRLAIITISPDKETQQKLNQQVAEFGKGKVLDQQKANALKQKEITETNAKVDGATRCLEIAAANGGEPGLCGSFLGGSKSAGVIINSK